MKRISKSEGYLNTAEYVGKFIDRPSEANEGDTYYAYDKLSTYMYTGAAWVQIDQKDDTSFDDLFKIIFTPDVDGSTVVLKNSSEETVTPEAAGKYAVVAGTYTYEVTKTGYNTVTGSKTVAATDLYVPIVMKQLFAVTFASDPSGANFVVKDKAEDTISPTSGTTYSLIEDETYSVTATKSGYSTEIFSYTPTKAETHTVALTATFTVTYAAGDGTGAVTDENSPYEDGMEVTVLPGTGLTPPANKAFNAWSDGETEYTPGDTFLIEANTTLTAVYVNTYTVTYAAGDGSGTVTDENSPYKTGTEVTVLDSAGLTPPAGKVFSTWNDGSADVAPGAKFSIEANTTLTAVYVDDGE